jgi:hypothetical protein
LASRAPSVTIFAGGGTKGAPATSASPIVLRRRRREGFQPRGGAGDVADAPRRARDGVREIGVHDESFLFFFDRRPL